MPNKSKKQRPRVNPPHLGLADLRKSHGLSQAQVAERIAVITDEPYYAGTVSLIEGGYRGTSEPVLRALEQIFGLREGSLRVDYAPTHSRRKVEDSAA